MRVLPLLEVGDVPQVRRRPHEAQRGAHQHDVPPYPHALPANKACWSLGAKQLALLASLRGVDPLPAGPGSRPEHTVAAGVLESHPSAPSPDRALTRAAVYQATGDNLGPLIVSVEK